MLLGVVNFTITLPIRSLAMKEVYTKRPDLFLIFVVPKITFSKGLSTFKTEDIVLVNSKACVANRFRVGVSYTKWRRV